MSVELKKEWEKKKRNVLGLLNDVLPIQYDKKREKKEKKRRKKLPQEDELRKYA